MKISITIRFVNLDHT